MRGFVEAGEDAEAEKGGGPLAGLADSNSGPDPTSPLPTIPS
jgi:hypothetical protein